ncbi:protein-disulfide reductase DsbD [Vibrio cholerae]|uniref:protein-disulfide reductase DsbD n=1 Tax=Vibrio cholerae TaxID=666 RepID=UPI0011D47B38|nr:protein-disulfide reductase DsbD [Vibrio cholerae]EGR2525666.1 protein-disulfide reductase DsbD [Vibrio cholerae]MCU4228069.1 protein-disulfide reductase DsbD [Vibrio cholerae]TXZ67979.1 protein-disulfide reductase DsbD [Vibrio cholerae]GIB59604.1 thiol:disulfide interchange protein DsbD [Vibrio cholerae]
MRTLILCFSLLFALLTQPAWALFGNNAGNNAGNNTGTASFAPTQNRFVPVDEAFPFNAFQQGSTLFIDWQVKEGYYLYQDRISISGEHLEISEYSLTEGEPYHDEFFGDVKIYTTPLSVPLPLVAYQSGAKVIVQYQGCAKAGFCYPPETRVIDITPFNAESNRVIEPKTNTSTQATLPQTDNAPTSAQDSLANKLAQNWWTPLLFLALGVGLAFTPCVLPMYPILTSIVLGGAQLTQRRALLLSVIYVQGMALTYTLLGLVVASAGLQFQAALQHPYVLIGLSVLFVALALSMFGLYNLQLPSGVQTWLNSLSNAQQGGSLPGVFAMGAISGLVCSPCTTAPLSGALLYVAQSGDLLTGAVALYALAIGMGIPLILVAVFGNKLLPKTGNWMERVKTLFGFVLLAAPIFLLERIVPEFWSSVLWSALGLAAFGWLYHVKNSLPFGGWKQSLIGIVAILGLLASAQPLLNHWLIPTQTAQQVKQIQFTRIANLSELQSALAEAKAQGKPVMLDFYADWCVACKEFEKYTFHAKQVENKLSGFVLLQADVTKNQPQDIELLKALNVLGLPTIEFWNAQGEPVPNARITGFMAEQPFLDHLTQQGL